MTRSADAVLALLLSLCWCISANANEPFPVGKTRPNSRQENDATNLNGEANKACPWGNPVDGIACRLVVQPRYVIGQAITAIVEVKNVSKKNRYIVRYLDPRLIDYSLISLSSPKGNLKLRYFAVPGLGKHSFQSIAGGEIKRFQVYDLRSYFGDLDPLRNSNLLIAGIYSLRLRFRSPRIPARFEGPNVAPKDAPAEWLADQWANEVVSAPMTFELLPLTKKDLVIHEWGVFTSFNNGKDVEAHHKREWACLPSFFYRQFPQERLRWVPAGWDKPVVYFYAKETPLELRVNVKFADGLPVVWWPAVVDPLNRGQSPDSVESPTPRPYRYLDWRLWVGPIVQNRDEWTGDPDPQQPWKKVNDFELPPDCWLRDARLPDASHLTAVGNPVDLPKPVAPWDVNRLETERFLFYDGLVPTPDYLRCEKVDPTSVTLRNRAKFDLRHLFVVDRRTPGKFAFARLDGKEDVFPPGATLTLPLCEIPKERLQAGIQQVKQAILDAGLFAPEADALLKIWRDGLFETEGLTVFHILPQEEYDRMLPLTITPKPEGKPVRVGIALHPHMEIEPPLVARIAALLHDLDDPAFAKRAAASKALVEMGPFAATVLRGELSQNPSLEMRHRIEEIVKQIDAADVQSLSPLAERKK